VTQILAHEKEPDLRPCLPCNTRTHLTGASGVKNVTQVLKIK